MFTRTGSGLVNQYMNFGVDAVIYIEGGSANLRLEEILEGGTCPASEDLKFWKSVFSLVRPDLKCKFVPIGSKSNLRQIADLVRSLRPRTLILAMDRDYDLVDRIPGAEPWIVATRGYSWENDVWQRSIVRETAIDVSQTALDEDELHREIAQLLDDFECELEDFVRWEFAVRCCESTDRAAPGVGRLYDVGDCGMPRIRREEVRRHIERRKETACREAMALASAANISVVRDIQGHLYSGYCCRIVSGSMKRARRNAVTPQSELVVRIALEKLFSSIREGEFEDLREHYRLQLEWCGPSDLNPAVTSTVQRRRA